MKLARTDFSLNPQALAVLHLVAGHDTDCDTYRVETSPWYNGRERGIVFSCAPNDFKVNMQHIAVFEHRNSDRLCALKWTEAFAMNPPTLESSGHLAYSTNNKFDDIVFSVGYGKIGKMASWVIEQMEEYIAANGKVNSL